MVVKEYFFKKADGIVIKFYSDEYKSIRFVADFDDSKYIEIKWEEKRFLDEYTDSYVFSYKVEDIIDTNCPKLLAVLKQAKNNKLTKLSILERLVNDLGRDWSSWDKFDKIASTIYLFNGDIFDEELRIPKHHKITITLEIVSITEAEFTFRCDNPFGGYKHINKYIEEKFPEIKTKIRGRITNKKYNEILKIALRILDKDVLDQAKIQTYISIM